MMLTVSNRLKANMLSIFREIERAGEEAVVTDRGIPVIKVQRLEDKRPLDEVFADLRGKVGCQRQPGLGSPGSGGSHNRGDGADSRRADHHLGRPNPEVLSTYDMVDWHASRTTR
jgi:antitoxin (DNA-binding transcriptional repressor) of toxin-antitoxin stability system